MLTQVEPQAGPVAPGKDRAFRPVLFCGHERSGLDLVREVCTRAGMFAGLSTDALVQAVRAETFRPGATQSWSGFARQPGALLVIVYAPPSWAIEAHAATNSDTWKAQLADWQQCNAELFRLAVRYPDACLLVNVLSAIHALDALTAHVADALGVKLADASNSAAALDRGLFQPLALHLADRGLPDHHPARTLYLELDSIATLDPEPLALGEREYEATMTEYGSMRDALSRSANDSVARNELSRANELLEIQLRQLREELDLNFRSSRAELELAEGRLRMLEESLEARANEMTSLRVALDRANEVLPQQARLADEQRSSFESAKAEFRRQLELAHEQVRQVRDETMALQLVSERDTKTLGERTEQLAQASQQRDEAYLQVKELREALNLSTSKADADTAEARRKEAELDEALQAGARKLIELQAQHDEQTKQLTASRAELAQSDAKRKELHKEGELLILQLHQTQEELEALYLRSQADAVSHRSALGQLSRERDDVAKQLGLEKSRAAEVVRDATEKAESTLLQLRQTREELESLQRQTQLAAAAHQALVDELSLERTRAAESSRRQQGDAELLLSRLHQAQEELEALHLKSEADTVVQLSLQEELNKLRAEIELKLLYLSQVQEELVHHVEQNESLASQLKETAEAADMLRRLWRNNQPADVMLDLRGAIDATNWHEPEHDGRWTGPLTRSTLKLPGMRAGLYTVQLDVVDAITPEALAGLSLTLNEVPVPLLNDGREFPCLVLGSVQIDPGTPPEWTLAFEVPQTSSPQSVGVDDPRLLGVRVRSVTFTLLEPAEEPAP